MDFLNTKLCFCLVLLIFGSLIYCDSIEQSKFDEILSFYETIDNYQAEFIQMNFWKDLDRELTSKGRIFFNNDTLLLKYQEPGKQLLYLTNEYVLLYDDQRKQALYSDKPEYQINPKQIIMELKMEDAKLDILSDSLLTISFTSSTDEYIVLYLSNFLIQKIVYSSVNGDFVEYSFKNHVINDGIDSQIFKIIIPEGTSIIDNRKKNF